MLTVRKLKQSWKLFSKLWLVYAFPGPNWCKIRLWGFFLTFNLCISDFFIKPFNIKTGQRQCYPHVILKASAGSSWFCPRLVSVVPAVHLQIKSKAGRYFWASRCCLAFPSGSSTKIWLKEIQVVAELYCWLVLVISSPAVTYRKVNCLL